MKKKILIIYTSIGMGHQVVAENIAQALRKYPEADVHMLDITKMYESRFTTNYAGAYVFVINHLPWLWRFFYLNKFFNALTLPFRLPLAGLKAGKMKIFLAELQPDLILTTQTTATAVISYLKKVGEYSGPLVTTFSDYHFQPYWFYPQVDHYLVMEEEQVEDLVKLGYPRGKIAITGLPVDDEFSRDQDVSEIVRALHLSKAKPIVLVMGGSRGWGVRIDDLRELLRTSLDVQFVAITGTDKAKAGQLAALRKQYPDAFRVFSNFDVQKVAALFQLAKVLVSKPGGLTVGQALVRQLPIIMLHPLPGMEDLNRRYLLQRGVAVSARDAREARSWMERLLRDQEYYRRLRERMKSVAHPNAAHLAARTVIDRLPR